MFGHGGKDAKCEGWIIFYVTYDGVCRDLNEARGFDGMGRYGIGVLKKYGRFSEALLIMKNVNCRFVAIGVQPIQPHAAFDDDEKVFRLVTHRKDQVSLFIRLQADFLCQLIHNRWCEPRKDWMGRDDVSFGFI